MSGSSYHFCMLYLASLTGIIPKILSVNQENTRLLRALWKSKSKIKHEKK